MPRKPKAPPVLLSDEGVIYQPSPAQPKYRVRSEVIGDSEIYWGEPDPNAFAHSVLYQAGYAAGVANVYRSLVNDPEATVARAKAAVEQTAEQARERARATVDRDRAADPAVKAALTQHLKRLQRDEAQASEFAALIRAGDSTETARAKMGIGAVRAKRLRAIAVKMKWIRRRQKKAGSIL